LNNKVIGILLYSVFLFILLWIISKPFSPPKNEFVIVKSGGCYSYTWDDYLMTHCYPSKEEAEDKILRMKETIREEAELEGKVWIKVEEN
tara:strand:+ start:15980 stop:16249 length:270 start_codon:yes stop_codon:yes gene_type:complete